MSKSLLAVSCFFGLLTLSACSSNSEHSKEPPPVFASDQPSASDIADSIQMAEGKGIGPISSVDMTPSVDEEMAEEGQKIFSTKCITCHQPTDQRLVGPGLIGITKIRKPEWIMNMIMNSEVMIKMDTAAKALYKHYGTPMTNQNLTKEEARKVLEFLRKNDANVAG